VTENCPGNWKFGICFWTSLYNEMVQDNDESAEVTTPCSMNKSCDLRFLNINITAAGSSTGYRRLYKI
jgi:hypothetical protein